MSTRAVIIVKGQEKADSVYLYRHSDGYPDGPCGVLTDIRKAWEWINTPHPMKYGQYDRSYKRHAAGYVASAIIITDGPTLGTQPTRPSLAYHSDAEYVYVVDPSVRGAWNVEVYATRFGNSARSCTIRQCERIASGPVDSVECIIG